MALGGSQKKDGVPGSGKAGLGGRGPWAAGVGGAMVGFGGRSAAGRGPMAAGGGPTAAVRGPTATARGRMAAPRGPTATARGPMVTARGPTAADGGRVCANADHEYPQLARLLVALAHRVKKMFVRVVTGTNHALNERRMCGQFIARLSGVLRNAVPQSAALCGRCVFGCPHRPCRATVGGTGTGVIQVAGGRSGV